MIWFQTSWTKLVPSFPGYFLVSSCSCSFFLVVVLLIHCMIFIFPREPLGKMEALFSFYLFLRLFCPVTALLCFVCV